MRVIGRAATAGRHDPSEASDPLEPARAVRRALAAAGRKAAEVDRLLVAASLRPSRSACRSLAIRALGRSRTEVPTQALALPTGSAGRLAVGAARVARRRLAQDAADWELAVCVGLGSDGRSVALCLARSDSAPAPPVRPSPPSRRDR